MRNIALTEVTVDGKSEGMPTGSSSSLSHWSSRSVTSAGRDPE